MPDPGSAAPATREQVFAWMAETGSGAKASATRFGIPVDRIKGWVRYHGDPRRPREPGPEPPPREGEGEGGEEPDPTTPSPPASPPRARVDTEPPPAPLPLRPSRQEPAPKPAPQPKPKPPNAAELLSPDDRARLVAHVRSLQLRLEKLDAAAQRELDKKSPDGRAVDAYTRSAAATAGEMERVLKAHPGLMALVETGSASTADEEAASIEAVYLQD